jgi:hypothetical protein
MLHWRDRNQETSLSILSPEFRDWVFTDGSLALFRMASLPNRRPAKIRGDANPYDPRQAGYFAERRAC